ncbi:hypothetical protein CAPTEDRAFT_179632 [Capitella teleta]|uniref:Presequence protease, mitochondrial n=1 Tax=Capitella teleta TaxID=283909 RepID=R7U837_CAPTE|nr:hypothetical protein CAPTEDRAFT_179632 [Capitella teleta]|eukprot:ELU02149.1 hypothetical protein CAPTEDRAFT_179632 [Capitella teleta]
MCLTNTHDYITCNISISHRCVLNKNIRQSSSVAIDRANALQQGQQIHGYTVQRVCNVPELHLTAVKLQHDATGAEHLHVARDDSNNVFSVAFRTTPMDSTGVPHILEHTALCGSKKFPVRDPFFKMLTRSLSTFMNAFTASDWTMYPFSTQNHQDYKNLMSVYLDAAFFPLLNETDFRQEGWRLENEDLQDSQSPITFKGVVYNEMKGVFSVSQQLFAQKLQNLLLPSHTYSVVSGGDPIDIPNLSWQQLKDFHASHYHPSNSRFFTYGDLPLENHLQQISENALDQFSKIDPNTEVLSEKRWDSPRSYRIKCNPDPMAPDQNKQTTIAVSYLLNDVSDTFETYTLSILGSLLTDGEKSPFYQSLIEPNIGSDFSPVLGYQGSVKEASFTVGLQGINEADTDKVLNIIEETFDKVIQDGFEQDRINAILHSIELSQKHQTDKFGLHLGVNLATAWMHNGDPVDAIQMNKHIDHLKECLRTQPNFFQDKLKECFKDNQHKLTLIMTPDVQFEADRQKQEAAKLDSMVSSLSESQRQDIFQKGHELLEEQSAEPDLSCLPTVSVNDINKEAPIVPTTVHSTNGVPIQLCEQPTNGVTYFRAIASMKGLPAHLKPYSSLFCSVATKMGAGDRNFKELSQEIELKTGGLNIGNHIQEHHATQHSFEESLIFDSMSLDQNIGAMFGLWSDIFTRLTLTQERRLMTLVMMSAAEMASSIANSGHMYAMTHASSALSAPNALREEVGGLAQVHLMRTVAEMKDLKPIIKILQDIAAHVFTEGNLRCALNATPDTMPTALKHAEAFIAGLPSKSSSEFYHQSPGFQRNVARTHFQLPFQVNFAAQSVEIVPYAHDDFASLRVLASVMSNKYLHKEIREKGGAYGGRAHCTPGTFGFYSYRDPNSMKTFDVFNRAVDWACEGSFQQQDIDEAKLSVFSQVDMPVPPGNRGMRLFQFGIDDAAFQQHRQALFGVTKQQLISVAEKYLLKNAASSTLLGPQNNETKASDKWICK